MYKTTIQSLAKLQALANEMSYGFSPADNAYWVGTIEQLRSKQVYQIINWWDITN